MANEDAGAAKLSSAELDALRGSLPHWKVDTSGEASKLVRKFAFDDFAAALAFTNKVGDAAEAANHHPLISLTWGEAQVEWWSHSAGGVTGSDVDMARATDGIFSAD